MKSADFPKVLQLSRRFRGIFDSSLFI